MEAITISREEYESLKATASKISIIEEVIHQPELSAEILFVLEEARKVPDSQMVSHEEMKRKLRI